MKIELQEQLEKKYSTLFKLPCYIECGGGWYKILDKLFEKISKDGTVRLVQVKEKFGELRIYVAYADKEIYLLIEEAEKKSLKVCEFCGAKGKPRKASWIKTLCNKCADRHYHREGSV